MKRPRALLLITAIGFAGLPPASAAFVMPSNVLVEDVVTQAHWRAYTVRGTGGWLYVDWNLPATTRPVQIGAWTYTADDLFLKGFDWTSFQYRDERYAHVQASPDLRISHEKRPNVYGAPLRVGVGDRLGAPGKPETFTMLIWFVGDVTPGIPFQLRGDDDIEIGESTTGPGRMWMNGDVDAGAQAGVQASVTPSDQYPNGFGGGVRATALGRTVVDIEHRLIGFFRYASSLGAAGGQANALLVSNGEWTRDCYGVMQVSCDWRHYAPASWGNSLPAGRYTFSQSGAGAGLSSFGETILTVLDVVFPSAQGGP